MVLPPGFVRVPKLINIGLLGVPMKTHLLGQDWGRVDISMISRYQ